MTTHASSLKASAILTNSQNTISESAPTSSARTMTEAAFRRAGCLLAARYDIPSVRKKPIIMPKAGIRLISSLLFWKTASMNDSVATCACTMCATSPGLA